jgi:hypothetical protein
MGTIVYEKTHAEERQDKIKEGGLWEENNRAALLLDDPH